MNPISSKGLVLVTGATGFLAAHCIFVLLNNNYRVRGTVRSLKDESKYHHIKTLVPEKAQNVEFVEAELLNMESWLTATKGCDYILHVASPFPSIEPKNEMELIRPAREGTLNVLNAALANGVKKVVVTSSIGTVMYGRAGKICNEDDWSLEAKCGAYEKSKLYAERAVWDFFKRNEGKIEITTINPGLIFGPTFNKKTFTSGGLVDKVFQNKMLGIPRISFPIVDVRDVAIAHYKALISPNSNGKRYCVCAESMWVEDILKALRDEFEQYGYKIVSRKVGKLSLQVASVFDPSVKLISQHVGLYYRVDNTKSIKELGLRYRSGKETFLEMGYNMIELGLVPNKITRPAL